MIRTWQSLLWVTGLGIGGCDLPLVPSGLGFCCFSDTGWKHYSGSQTLPAQSLPFANMLPTKTGYWTLWPHLIDFPSLHQSSQLRNSKPIHTVATLQARGLMYFNPCWGLCIWSFEVLGISLSSVFKHFFKTIRLLILIMARWSRQQ